MPDEEDPDLQQAINEVCAQQASMLSARRPAGMACYTPACQLIFWFLLCLQVCNRGVRLMLKDPRPVEMEDYRSEISELGAYFSNKGNMEGATFM